MKDLLPHTRPKGRLHDYIPVDLSQDWQVGAIVKVKTVRAAAFSGREDFALHDCSVARCVGCIELVGAKVGSTSPVLFIAFTLAKPSAPTFTLRQREATGTLVLAAHLFNAHMCIAHSPSVYFRVGGNGSCNAIANELTILSQ